MAHAYSAFGVGIWVHKYRQMNNYMDKEQALDILHSYSKTWKLFKKKRHIMVNRLIYRLARNRGIGDLMWRIYSALEDKYCIMPLISKVRNCGHDGSGINCILNETYLKEAIDAEKTFNYDKIATEEDRFIKQKIDKLYGGNWIIRRFVEIQYLCYRLWGIDINTQFKKYFK